MTTDRRRLESMTREDLVREAARIGVPDPENLERRELVEEILAREPKTPGALARSLLSRAKGFVEQAVVVARSLYEEGKKTASENGYDAPPPPPPPPPRPTEAAESVVEDEDEDGGGSVGERPVEEVKEEKPLATSTLGQVYEAQGHLDEARRIYEEVLDRDPNDSGARDGMLRLRADPPSRPQPATPESMTLVAVDPRTLHAYWDVTEGGVARASAAVGGPGRLVLRLFGSHPAGGTVVTTSHDEEIGARHGEWFFRNVRPAGVYHAAVGLAAEGRFMPVAKAGPARTPAGEPSADVTVELAEWLPEPAGAAPPVPRRVPVERRAGPPAREYRLAPSSRLR
jgi:hypothetical protein